MQRILLVEDDAIIAMAQASQLRRSGYDVILAYSGEGAVAAVDAADPPLDLVLMDVDLGPGMDGTEAASRILKAHDTPIIFVSSHTEKEMVEKTERITSYGYVVKHSGETVLLASIKMAFRLYNAYRALKGREEELRSTNEKYRRSQIRARIGSWDHDLVRDELWWSDGMYEILGFSQGSIDLPAVTACFPPAEQVRFASAVKQAIEEAVPYSMDYTFVRPDGRVLKIHDEGDLICDAAGKPLQMYGTTQDITDVWETQHHLRQLSRSVEQSPATVVITDLAGAIEYVNPKFTETTGYTIDEVLGKNPRVLKSGETPGAAYKAMWDTIASGKEWRGVFHNRRKDGSLYWESASISPITDADGVITNFVAVKEDITSRKMSELAVEESEAKYRGLVEGTTMGLFINQGMKIVYVNPAALAMVGASHPEQVLGHSPLDFFAPEVHAAIRARIQHMQSSGEPVGAADEPLRRVDGTFLEAEVTAHPIRYNGASAIQVVIRDVSVTRRAERRLREHEEVLKMVAALDPYHVVVQDADLRYTMVINPQLGLSVEDMIGRTDFEILGHDEAERLTAVKKKVLDTGESVHMRDTVLSHQGHPETFDGMYVPLRNADGTVTGVIGYFRNVTAP